jgi:hypothetical protein
VAKQRNYKAEYQARAARAKTLGYTGNRERTIARKAERIEAKGRLKAGDTTKGAAAIFSRSKAKQAKILRLPAIPDAHTVNSSDARFLRSQLRGAAKAGNRVMLTAKVNMLTGKVIGKVQLFIGPASRIPGGGVDPTKMLAVLRLLGDDLGAFGALVVDTAKRRYVKATGAPKPQNLPEYQTVTIRTDAELEDFLDEVDSDDGDEYGEDFDDES